MSLLDSDLEPNSNDFVSTDIDGYLCNVSSAASQYQIGDVVHCHGRGARGGEGEEKKRWKSRGEGVGEEEERRKRRKIGGGVEEKE